MSPTENKVLECALVLWVACVVVACGAATENNGGESNWVQCNDDDDCPIGEICEQDRCAPEADASTQSIIEQDASASMPSSDTETDGSGGVSGAVPLPATASSVDAGPVNPEPGSGGAGGAVGEPTPGGGAGGNPAPDTQATHCAFPSPDRRSEPSGVVSDALPFSTDACVSALTAPVALELPDAQGHQTLAFAYDVNQDGIDDLFYRDRDADPEQPFNLWVSEVSDGELRFVHEPCALPTPASEAARRLHVRDLDADGTPDLIVEGLNWVIALRNEPAGFTTTLVHAFTPSEPGGWASLVDVAVADVTGDSAHDLIIGFDRTPDGAVLAEVGVLIFEGHADSSELTVSHSWVSPIGVAPVDPAPIYWGNFAIIETATSDVQLWLQVRQESEWQIAESLTSGAILPLNPSMGAVYKIWGDNGLGGIPLIGVLGNTVDLTDRLDLFAVSGESTMFEVGGLEPVFLASDNRELGGGAGLPQQFLLDVDSNTTTDFVEFNVTADSNAQQLAIHLGDLQIHFQPPVVLSLPTLRARYSYPFLSIGERALGLIAYDAQNPVSVDDAGTPPMVQRFSCD